MAIGINLHNFKQSNNEYNTHSKKSYNICINSVFCKLIKTEKVKTPVHTKFLNNRSAMMVWNAFNMMFT